MGKRERVQAFPSWRLRKKNGNSSIYASNLATFQIWGEKIKGVRKFLNSKFSKQSATFSEFLTLTVFSHLKYKQHLDSVRGLHPTYLLQTLLWQSWGSKDSPDSAVVLAGSQAGHSCQQPQQPLLCSLGQLRVQRPLFPPVGTKQGNVQEDQRKLPGKWRRARVCETSLS